MTFSRSMLLNLIIIGAVFALTGCVSGAIGALVIMTIFEAIRCAGKRA